MEKNTHNDLILRADGAVEKAGSGAKSILATMVSDTLALVRSRAEALSETRFTIGSYEFRDLDYRQILLWAAALGIEPLEVITRLESCHANSCSLKVEDGSIVELAWDFHLLPLANLEWLNGLTIRSASFTSNKGEFIPKLFLNLVFLEKLSCNGIGLLELDLSSVPALTDLDCGNNQLTELNLSNVPALDTLSLSGNRLTELNLSYTPRLMDIFCSDNQLSKLDLSYAPNLDGLNFSYNQITKLDLSHAPGLSFLDCSNNKLTELNLSHVSDLSFLDCSSNQLTELDLSHVPYLHFLECSINQLTELNLLQALRLTRLHCSNNQISKLDLSHSQSLTELDCDYFVVVTQPTNK